MPRRADRLAQLGDALRGRLRAIGSPSSPIKGSSIRSISGSCKAYRIFLWGRWRNWNDIHPLVRAELSDKDFTNYLYADIPQKHFFVLAKDALRRIANGIQA